MRSRGTQRPGAVGICGNTVAMVNAICDRGACFRNLWLTSEKLNATSFAATTLRYKHFGERTHGILRDSTPIELVRAGLALVMRVGAMSERDLQLRAANEFQI